MAGFLADAGFPRLYAAASLKRMPARIPGVFGDGFPRLYAAASLKHQCGELRVCLSIVCFPRLYAAASLKPPIHDDLDPVFCRFPRLYAAASLKLHHGDDTAIHFDRFPRLYAAASLKPAGLSAAGGGSV